MVQQQLMSRLKRGTIEAFVLHAAGMGLLLLMQVYLGRTLGKAGYGVLSYALALAGVLAILVPLGWPTALMRFIARYTEEERWGLLRGAVNMAYAVTFLSTGVVSLALLALSFWDAVPEKLLLSLRYAALLLLFLAFVGLRRKALQGLGRVRGSLVPEEILLPVLVISGVYFLGVSTAGGTLLVYSGAALAAFALGGLWLWRAMPEGAKAAKPEYEGRAWMAVALPMMFGGVSQIAMNRADVLILGALAGVEAVGLYGAAARIASVNVFVLGAVNQLAAPMMARAFHGGRPAQVGAILRRAMLWSAVGALPLFLPMVLFPEALIRLAFGPGFAEGADLLRVLAFGQFVNAATGPVGFALLMTGRERTYAWVTGAAGTATVLGCLLAIPAFGAMGAAVVTTLAVASLNVSLLLLGWRGVVRPSGGDG